MTTLELQNSIIRKVLDIKDPVLLDFVIDILDGNENSSVYQFTETERKLIEESISAYSTGNIADHDEVTNRLERWLGE